jgi:hypothetical protein
MGEPEERHAPRRAKLGLGVGSALLFLVGLFVGLLLRELTLGVLLFALGTILFALRGYLETGDKVLAGAMIFIASVAIGIEAVVYFLGPRIPKSQELKLFLVSRRLGNSSPGCSGPLRLPDEIASGAHGVSAISVKTLMSFKGYSHARRSYYR